MSIPIILVYYFSYLSNKVNTVENNHLDSNMNLSIRLSIRTLVPSYLRKLEPKMFPTYLISYIDERVQIEIENEIRINRELSNASDNVSFIGSNWIIYEINVMGIKISYSKFINSENNNSLATNPRYYINSNLN